MKSLISALMVGLSFVLPAYALRSDGELVSRYVVGLVSNAELPAPSGELILTVYLSVVGDVGVGTLSDPVHPGINSHLTIRRSLRQGNRLQFDGEISRSNDPARVGLTVQVVAILHGETTSELEVSVDGEIFSGQGFTLRSVGKLTPDKVE